MKLLYDEWYGQLSYAQRAAYRKHNVSPADHTELVRRFGEESHAQITKFVNAHSRDGTYRDPQWA